MKALQPQIDKAQAAVADKTYRRKKLILEAYEAGVSAAEIARYAGISRQRVHRIIKGE